MADSDSVVLKQNRAPVFVVGAPRSGTTLVATILGRHNNIFAAGESHYFEDMWSRRHELGDLKSEDSITTAVDRMMTLFGRFNFPDTQSIVDRIIDRQALVAKVHQLGGGYGSLYYAFVSLLAESKGKTYFCDDTPKHLYYLHTIFDFFHEAKVIGCVRDPRDFLCSYKNYWRKSEDSARVKALFHPVVTSLLWSSSSNLLLKHSNGSYHDRILLIQYEKLVEKPQIEVRRICDFLGVDYSDELTQVNVHNSSFEQASTGIFSNSIGRWHTCLSVEEAWWVQQLTKKYMNALSYAARPVVPSWRILLQDIVTAPFVFARALQANSEKRGPLPGYIWRRLLAIVQR